MTRTDASYHLAKVFAYLAVGRVASAEQHAAILIKWLSSIGEHATWGEL